MDGARFNLAGKSPLRIGFGAQDHFHGDLADLRIYKGALSEAELKAISSEAKRHGKFRRFRRPDRATASSGNSASIEQAGTRSAWSGLHHSNRDCPRRVGFNIPISLIEHLIQIHHLIAQHGPCSEAGLVEGWIGC